MLGVVEWSSGGWGSAHSTWCEWSRWWIAWQGASGTWWDNKRQKAELVEQAELVKWQALVEERGPVEPQADRGSCSEEGLPPRPSSTRPLPFEGKQLVSPPAPPLLMGNWFLGKCQMPLPLVLRLKKLMHDVGNIEPESIFLSVIHFESLGVWRLGFKRNIMRQGKKETVAQLE